jgi:hypothetical protein
MGEPENQVAAESNGKPPINFADWRGTDTGHPMKVWRKAYQITLDDISFLTGISVASLSRIERYKQTPLIGAAQKIINISHGNLNPSDFFNDPV